MSALEYTIAADRAPIDLVPNDEIQEILQNVRTIISTTRGSVPLDRAFGIDPNVIDIPMLQAKAKITNEILRAIRKYEPRAKVSRITFTGDLNGRLVPDVSITITPRG